MTSTPLRVLGAFVMLGRPGFSWVAHSETHTHPVHLMGSPSLPRPPFAHKQTPVVQDYPTCSPSPTTQCPRLRSRLTLGRLTLPRNPQAFGVSGSHRHDATHSGIRTSLPSTSPYGLASQVSKNAPLPSPSADGDPRLRSDA